MTQDIGPPGVALKLQSGTVRTLLPIGNFGGERGLADAGATLRPGAIAWRKVSLSPQPETCPSDPMDESPGTPQSFDEESLSAVGAVIVGLKLR
jgi:hypothetical protein